MDENGEDQARDSSPPTPEEAADGRNSARGSDRSMTGGTAGSDAPTLDETADRRAREAAPADDEIRDPVQERFAGERDLYEIATWEVRSPLDAGIVSLIDTVGTRKRDLLIALALSLFLGQVVIAGVFVFEAPILAVLSALSIVPAFLLVVTIWSRDPTAREPLSLLGVTFVLAALFASFAAVVNSLLLPGFEVIPLVGMPLFFFLVVGPIEEFVKVLAVRVYAFGSDQFETVVDGAVYGAVAGLGFAAIENLIYIVYFSVTVTPVATIIEQQYAVAIAVTRSFVGPGHVVFSAWAGFYLGLAKFNPENRLPILLKGVVIAAFIHALYNTIVSVVPLTTASFVGFVAGYLLLWFSLLWVKVSRYRELYQVATEQEPPGTGPGGQ